MGNSNCNPVFENCVTQKFVQDENKSPYPNILNKHPMNLFDSKASISSKHLELYQQQQNELKNFLSKSLTQSTYQRIEFQNRFMKLPHQVINLILYFCIDNYVDLLTLNSLWHNRLNHSLNQAHNRIENLFIQQYQFLKLRQCKTRFNRFTINQNHKGFRLDRLLNAEVLAGYENSLIKIGYSYVNKKNKEQFVFYKFVIYKQDTKKSIWISIDQSSNIYDKRTYPIVQNTLAFCVGDQIKLSVNILNQTGLMDLKSFKWLPYQIEKLEVKIFQSPKHISMYPPSSLENKDIDWVLYEYFQNPMKKCFDQLKHLILKECRCNGVNIITSRMKYLCESPGLISFRNLNLSLTITQDNCINEIKRVSLIQDQPLQLQLKVGDELILYYTRSQLESVN
ncbi:hypothetical protein pb186bvf_003464 [Paramecium bursaria]